MGSRKVQRSNTLITEKSPYLLQHAHNPVNWYPWGEEAFDKAKEENKLVFLSIGYSTCHWCHVMERESFEDEEVAEVLNRDFISIKVDREERPDIDHLYMAVCQAMTGRGGWPLTVILTPDKHPFFAGTYIPKQRKKNHFGMMDLLPQAAKKWSEHPQKVKALGLQIVEETEKRMLSNMEGQINDKTLLVGYETYASSFDPQYGGFGVAPKFPTPHNLSFLLRYYHDTGEQKALDIVEHTLVSMYRGGLYDHIGKGFSRYSTDNQWLVPHFEKMLYDNALLAMAYIEAYQITRKPLYKQVAEEIFEYVLRDMTDEAGGFYSAEDADSEGEEGKFYVWTPEEVYKILGEEEGSLYCELFDITEKGNFEGRSVPNLIEQWPEQYAEAHDMNLAELVERIQHCREALYQAREERVHPFKDDKILTSWNGLMIMALAKGAKALGRSDYMEAAKRSFQFIWTRLRREDGRLLARYRDGEAAILGFIDDYAFLLWGCMELYEATFDPDYLEKAVHISDAMIELFWDADQGGFFFYGNDSEQLFTRNKEIYDGAIPSGNSVALYNLIRLSRMTANERYADICTQTIQAFAGALDRYPAGHSILLSSLLLESKPSREIVIAGMKEADQSQAMVKEIYQRFLPNTLILFNTPEYEQALEKLIPLVQGKRAKNNTTMAYICEDFSCQAPIMHFDAFVDHLNAQKS